MVYVILDIETLAHPDAHLWVDPVKPDARLRDPVKIEDDIKEKTAARDAAFGLHPDTNIICALGYHVVGGDDPTCLLMRDEYEEREMVRQFWDVYRALDKRQEVRLVTFFGLSFDIPTLLSRSMWLDVEYPEISTDKYRSPHAPYDLCWRLSRHGAIKPMSLKFYAKRAGLGTLDKVDGSQIAELVKADDWNGVEQHCLSDIGLTHALANRMKVLKVA
jgi:hypothetical protein